MVVWGPPPAGISTQLPMACISVLGRRRQFPRVGRNLRRRLYPAEAASSAGVPISPKAPRRSSRNRDLDIGLAASPGVTSVNSHSSEALSCNEGHRKDAVGRHSWPKKSRRVLHRDHPWNSTSGVAHRYDGRAPFFLAFPWLHSNSRNFGWAAIIFDLWMCSYRTQLTADWIMKVRIIM